MDKKVVLKIKLTWMTFLMVMYCCISSSKCQSSLSTENYQTTAWTTTNAPTTTAPSTPTPPATWCCTYETRDDCAWVLDGWYSSILVVPSTFTVPPHDGEYIWEEGTASTEISSVLLTDLPNHAEFSVDYFFNTQTTNVDTSYIQFSFLTDLGTESIEITWPAISSNSSIWVTKTFHSNGGICNGYLYCDGTFYVRTSNEVTNIQVAAVDNFRVNSASC